MDKKYIKNGTFFTWVLLDFSISFMLTIFAPIDAFYANPDEYWFSLSQLLSVSMIVFIVVFAILIVFSILISKTSLNDLFLSIFLVLFIYLYIQGNYIPRNYGVLDGRTIDWNSFTAYSAVSLGVLVICIAAGIFLMLKYRSYLPSVVKVVSIILLVIQISTITTLVLQNGRIYAEETNVVTSKDLLDFSSDNNIIVFLLDSYDGTLLNSVIEKDFANQSEIFDNFTYYKDTLGAYPTTKCALPMILTGNWYQNEVPYIDYVKASYKDNLIYNAFRDNNFELNVYTFITFLSPNVDLYKNIETGKYEIKDKKSFAQKIYSLVAFNYMPHQLKKHFVLYSGEFDGLRKIASKETVFSENMIEFLDLFHTSGINVSKTGNLFKFIHLEGTHAPATFGKDLVEDGKNYGSIDEAEGNNEMLKEIFSEFQEKGIYDNSTIVIMADHGSVGYNQNPIFLIKNANEKHPFAISDEKLSFDNLITIWIALAKNEIVNENFIRNLNNKNTQRRFLFYRWDDAWKRDYMPGMAEFLCEGEANYNNLNPTGRVFLAYGENHVYQLGKTLDFIDGRTAYSYCLYGCSMNGNITNDALMQFDIKGDFNNLMTELYLSDSCGMGNVSIYVNDQLITEQAYDSKKGIISFVIPKEYVSDKRISMKFIHDNTEKETYFYALSPLFLNKIKILNTDKQFDLQSQRTAYQYKFGDKLFFSKDDPSGNQYIQTGFSYPESEFTWSDGKDAKILFNIPNVTNDLMLTMNYGIFNGSQMVRVLANGNLLEEYIAHEGEEKQIRIPHDILVADEVKKGDFCQLALEFEFPDAVSPKSLGESEDVRLLALAFKSMTLSEANESIAGADD